jgi:hypothetical protein
MRSALMKRTVVPEASLCTIAYHGCGGGIESKRSALMQGCSGPARGLEPSTLSCCSQRRRRAWPNLSSLGPPAPERSLVELFAIIVLLILGFFLYL